MDHNYQNISVGEMHLNGLRYAKSYGIKNCYQFDLYQTPFENMFDVVAMFDVLEHLSDDELALNQCFKMLRNNGLIIITVPAHMWLWSRNDRVAGHKRRYTKNEIKEKMVKVGFEIIEIKYFFILITPLLYLRSLIDQDDGSPISNKENFKYFNLPSYVNLALMLICNFEKFIQKLLPDKFGGSLILIGKKGSVINSVSFL